MRKILGVRWFSGCGIVRVEMDFIEIKYFIKSIQPFGGASEKQDMEDIADWGSTFPNDAGDVLFGVK